MKPIKNLLKPIAIGIFLLTAAATALTPSPECSGCDFEWFYHSHVNQGEQLVTESGDSSDATDMPGINEDAVWTINGEEVLRISATWDSGDSLDGTCIEELGYCDPNDPCETGLTLQLTWPAGWTLNHVFSSEVEVFCSGGTGTLNSHATDAPVAGPKTDYELNLFGDIVCGGLENETFSLTKGTDKIWLSWDAICYPCCSSEQKASLKAAMMKKYR